MKKDVSLRPATTNDIDQIYEWICEPSIRTMCHHKAAPTWENHIQWIKNRLRQSAPYLIAEIGGQPVGQIRFDPILEASVLIDPHYQRKGIGTRLIQDGTMQVEGPCIARIPPGNAPSLAAFQSAGYHHPKEVVLCAE